MPSKREIITLLKRDELNEVVDRFELDVADRRAKDGLVDAVAASRTATLDALLGGMKRERLKELCRALGLDDAGKEKAEIVERLTGRGSVERTEPAAVEGRDAKRPALPEAEPVPERPVRAARAKGTKSNGSPLGFEAQLWAAADALRNNMDAAEYKHVVLGLIFLKYISDAFEAKHAELDAQRAKGADPEDPDEYRAINIFWVPKEARWSFLKANAPQPTIGTLVDDAMSAIERDNPTLKGVLPKDFGRTGLDKQRLGQIINLVSDIELISPLPPGEGPGMRVDRAKDTLGRVYEYARPVLDEP